MEFYLLIGLVILLLILNVFLFREVARLSARLEGWEGWEGLRESLRHSLELIQDLRRHTESLPPVEENVKKLVVELAHITRILGGRGSGKGGEYFLEEILQALPPDILLHQVEMGGGRVDLALRLPDGRLVPVDSKFVESWENSRQLATRILSRTKELSKYLQDPRAAGFAVAVVPDGAYQEARRALSRAVLENRVIIVPYSQALTILLFILALAPRFRVSSPDWEEITRKLEELAQILPQQEKLLQQLLQKHLKISQLIIKLREEVQHGKRIESPSQEGK